MKCIQLKNNYKPWVSKLTKTFIKNRDILREKVRRSSLPFDWKDYKIARNKCTGKLHKYKLEFHRNLYKKIEIERDTSNMYKLTRQQLGWKKGGTPDSLLVDGNRVSSPALLANIQLDTFNIFFLTCRKSA